MMQLEDVASALGPLLSDVIFVGGSTTTLLVDEAAHHGVRYTEDVDVIVDVATQIEYQKIGKQLRKLGFKEDVESGVICRWLYKGKAGEITLDVMPTDEKILGFSNRWYKGAISTATKIKLSSGTIIRVVTPPYFIATKFEAFSGRGKGDYAASHDLEDIIFVLENRERIIFELKESSEELKRYFADQAAMLLDDDDFLNVLPGLMNSPGSPNVVENNLNIMKSWA